MSGGPNVIIKGGCILACGLDWPFLPPRPLPLGAALWPEDFGEGARLITDTAPPAVLEIGSSCAVRGSCTRKRFTSSSATSSPLLAQLLALFGPGVGYS